MSDDDIDGLDFEPEGFEDITPAINAAAERITGELTQRLEGDLSAGDAAALGAAVTKAAAAGAREALAAVNRSLARQRSTIAFSVPITADVDIWAERFGDEAAESE